MRQPSGLLFFPPRSNLPGARRHAVAVEHVKPQVAAVVRPPVIDIVLFVPCIEVSGLETEGTLAKMVYLLTWLQLFA